MLVSIISVLWISPVCLLTCDDVHHDGVRDAGGGAAGVLPPVLQPHPRDPEHQHVVTKSERDTESSLQLGDKFVRTSLLSQHSSYILGKLHYSISRPNCLLVKAKYWKWDTEISYISGISTPFVISLQWTMNSQLWLYKHDRACWQWQRWAAGTRCLLSLTLPAATATLHFIWLMMNAAPS